MKSEQLGKDTSVRVLGVNPLGLWLLADNEEHFLSFEEFPWFQSAPVKAVFNVEKQGRSGFCWPDLDVDLTLDGIKNPDKYPLKAKH
ncbi:MULTISPECIES: DUF2442 domain-containing protein [Shewanella]|uniref:Integron cassette protein n=1 Tax=Shewanella baltica (strain OS195) TaxID=399599 RepID=A9L6E7_SHEB9|nr:MULTISPECIES: DUF2442 domain-containing protein [Shewanella]ABX51729.1 conserved hypothetical protein [Shewanella baltica OS195]MCU8036421.1 DUF2442 domain-containing protein [Shewanella sp. SM71]MCU8098368.1 DUF2442 domain-containing protein [Shewanella sp. SM102]